MPTLREALAIAGAHYQAGRQSDAGALDHLAGMVQRGSAVNRYARGNGHK